MPKAAELQLDTIHTGDSRLILESIPDNSIDLIFADPPYNLQLKNELWRPNNTKVSAVNDDWDKYDSFEAYDTFTDKWLSECRRILKPNGALWVIGSYHNIFRVGKSLQDLGYWILNDILWVKTNPMPNFKGTRFNNSHETLIWAAKSQASKPVFNYKTMKTANEDKQMRSDWHIAISGGKERAKIDGHKAHSTQKPLALLRRVILATTKAGDIILDPFMGSGTTAVAAKELGRHFIGIEQDPTYVEVATRRINETHPNFLEHLISTLEVKPPRVAFGTLVETGDIPAGSVLTDKRGEHPAVVMVNGSVKIPDFEGSIHKVGAHVQNQPTCNGWTFWYLKGHPIDELRQAYIKANYA